MPKLPLCLLAFPLLMTGIGVASAGGPSSAPTTLAQSAPSTPVLTCCFGDAAPGQCTQTSPNQTGCEWLLVYNCGKAGYSCDADKGVCRCNTTAADSSQAQPSQ